MEPWKKTIYISWTIIFIHTAGTGMVMPFLPLYIRELGITDPQAQSLWSGILYGVTSVFGGLLAPVWGTISDKYGRKPMILRTTLGVTIVALLMSICTNVYQLLALRIVHGICAGMIPAFIALVSFNLPHDKTGEGLGTMQSAKFSGQIIGPFIGGLLADLMGYRNVLLVLAFMTFMAFLSTMLFINESKRDSTRGRSTVMSNFKLVLSSPHLRAITIILFVIQFSLHIIQPILPLFIVSLHETGNSATMVGLVFAITGFATLIFAPYWGQAGDKKGHRKILSQSLLFTGIAFLPQALVTSAYQLLPLRAIMGFFIAGIMPSIQTMIVHNTKDSQRGGVLGITHSVQSCGHALGPLVGGVVGALLGFRFSITLTALLLIAIWYFFSAVMKKADTVTTLPE
jgi:MFS transporter, DHA1 family, multidrug resistance protein